MKVLVHAVVAHMGGAARHLRALTGRLSEHGGGHDYLVLVHEGFGPRPDDERVRFLPVREGGAAWRLGFDQVIVPRLVREHGCDVLVSLLNLGPVRAPVPHVLFQRNALYYSLVGQTALPPARRRANRWRGRLALAAMREAAAVVTPSRAMADLIHEVAPWTASLRFETIHHGFEAGGLTQEPLDPALAARLGEAGAGDADPGEAGASGRLLILYPTHATRYKGFEVLLDALARVKEDGRDFLFVTTIDDADHPAYVAEVRDRVARRGLEGEVRILGRVPPGQIGHLYERADLVVYGSRCESFGFPMLEALGFGRPLVAVRTAVNEEVSGGAARFYEPGDVGGATDAILAAFDEGTRRALAAASREAFACRDWSWARVARELGALVNDVGGAR